MKKLSHDKSQREVAAAISQMSQKTSLFIFRPSFVDNRTVFSAFRKQKQQLEFNPLSLSFSLTLALSLSPGHAPPGDGDTGAEVPRERTDVSERPVRFDRPVAVARAETETRFADEQNVRNGIFGSV